MPSVSAPEIGGGIYTPGQLFPGANGKKSSEKKTEPKPEIQQGGRTSGSVSDGKKEKDAKTITAGELSALSSLGFFDTASILYGNSKAGMISSARETAEAKKMLAEVLSKIEELQKTSPAVSAAEPAKKIPAATEHVPDSRHAKVLRFCVNGYDILKTCKKIYISNVQQDGTFLVTGDRRYASDGKSRTETFHLLFISAPQKNGCNYTASAAVTQDYLNEYSFLYQLSQLQEVNALRTGNLVTMRTEQPDWKLELLIDLGEE